eukprot:SAG22_NODE_4216_length_1340_cov_1.432716_1_plen_136_part_10
MLQTCCRIRRCECQRGIECRCPPQLDQPELLPLLQLLERCSIDRETLETSQLRKLSSLLSRAALPDDPPPEVVQVQQAAAALSDMCEGIHASATERPKRRRALTASAGAVGSKRPARDPGNAAAGEQAPEETSPGA